MKRKPLWLEEQRHLIRFHTHQNQYWNFISGPYTVKLPSKENVLPAIPFGETSNSQIETVLEEDSAKDDAEKTGIPGAVSIRPSTNSREHPTSTPHHPTSAPSGRAGGHEGRTWSYEGQAGATTPSTRPFNKEQLQPNVMKRRLDQIQDDNNVARGSSGQPVFSHPSMLSGRGGVGAPQQNFRFHAMQQHHLQQQQKMHYLRCMEAHRFQQRQQQIMGQQQYSQYRAAAAAGMGHTPQMMTGGMHPSQQVQPMHANPPIQMQHVMHQRQQVSYSTPPQAHPGAHIGMMGGPLPPQPAMVPGEQPGMQQYPQQNPPGIYMNPGMH